MFQRLASWLEWQQDAANDSRCQTRKFEWADELFQSFQKGTQYSADINLFKLIEF